MRDHEIKSVEGHETNEKPTSSRTASTDALPHADKVLGAQAAGSNTFLDIAPSAQVTRVMKNRSYFNFVFSSCSLVVKKHDISILKHFFITSFEVFRQEKSNT